MEFEDEKKGAITCGENIQNAMREIKYEMEIYFNKIANYLDRIDKKIDNVPTSSNRVKRIEKNTIQNEIFTFPISCDEEIEKLEEKIRADEKFKTRLIAYLAKIGGKTGQEDGIKIGYKIVDHIFIPSLLTNYSWTGIARGQTSEKKCFQNFQALLDVFFNVIYLADNRHTKQKNCNLFKDGVLKHAKKRSLRKRSLIQTIEEVHNTCSDNETNGNELEELLQNAEEADIQYNI